MRTKNIHHFITSICEEECVRREHVSSCLHYTSNEDLAMIQASLGRQIKRLPWNSPDVIPLAQLSLLIQRELINRRKKLRIE